MDLAIGAKQGASVTEMVDGLAIDELRRLTALPLAP
jgi:hypothetical protein